MIYDISYKTFIGSVPLRIRLHEIDGFIEIYNVMRYLALFSNSWHGRICDRSKYLVSKGITESNSDNFPRIRIDSYNSSPVE